MENYVREHSFGSILKSTFAIYVSGFWTFFLTYFLPVFPFMAIQQEAQFREQWLLFWLSAIAGAVVGIFAYGASVVSVSDICLGNRPSLVRSYSRVFGPVAWKMFVTSLLQLVIVAIGFLLLIIPGMVFMVWLLFSPIIVVLEGPWGRAALKRSKALGKGYYWRSFGVFLVLIVIAGVIGGVIGGVISLAVSHATDHWAFRLAILAIPAGVSIPIAFITFVLIYYDLRARKEAYDARLLAEELRQ